MKSNPSIMKITWKKLFVLPVLLAVAVAPLSAESINSSDPATNPTVLNAPAPPTPPEPPAPPESSQDDASVTNQGHAKHNRTDDENDHPSVSIGPTGIHIGGPNPVDIGVPELGNRGDGSGFSSLLKDVVAIVAITAPFLFLIVLAAVFFQYRNRRQRLLHDTLRAMIDKGVPIPPELLAPQERAAPRRARSDLRTGLILVGTGVGLLILQVPVSRLGWIPILIGVAFLITWLIERRNNNGNNGPTKP